jgi:hypothetical protein
LRARIGAAALVAAACVGVTAVATTASAGGAGVARPRGNIRIFAHIAKPGEPSLTLVTPNRKVFVGTFEDAAGTDTSASKVFEYTSTGRLQRTFVIRGQTPGVAHGVQVAARDRKGRLYVLDQNPARVIVLNPRTGRQRTYASFANVPTCAAAGRTTNCSNSATDGAPEPDYAAWLPDGSLLVTDYTQQLVWRVPPHGGKARVWLNDKRLDGEVFGPAGIVMMPGHHNLLMTVATSGLTSGGAASAQGKLYRIELTRHHRFHKLVPLWSSAAGAAPDGFAVSRSRRHVYIAMAGPTGNSVVEVAHRGAHWTSIWTAPKTADGVGSSPVMWDTATSVQFLGRRLLVTNQAFFSDIAAHWVVFDVEARERGLSTYVPPSAG